MTPRPALGPALAALCALLTLTACQGSPDAGRPNTTPPSPTATPTPTAPSTPAWTSEEQAAITAAKARYVSARAAVEEALRDPRKSSREPLEKAGNGGSWILTAIEQVRFEREQGWYLSGTVKITSIDVVSADLRLAQPEVRLTSCVDSSNAKTLYQATGKPVPLKGSPDKHRRFQSRLVMAAPTDGGQKMWFLIEEKAVGGC